MTSINLSNTGLTKIENLNDGLQTLILNSNKITKIENLNEGLQLLSLHNNPIEYINPKLYKHRLAKQLCNYIDTTPDRLKVCYYWKMAYSVLVIQRIWRKKLDALKILDARKILKNIEVMDMDNICLSIEI